MIKVVIIWACLRIFFTTIIYGLDMCDIGSGGWFWNLGPLGHFFWWTTGTYFILYIVTNFDSHLYYILSFVRWKFPTRSQYLFFIYDCICVCFICMYLCARVSLCLCTQTRRQTYIKSTKWVLWMPNHTRFWTPCHN